MRSKEMADLFSTSLAQGLARIKDVSVRAYQRIRNGQLEYVKAHLRSRPRRQ